ncbi:uncharacterized protein LOC128558007 [Mercenaria mercenaria]|uniref:uncharacterized protein LOC128558007 n=1 Tax=Mercenaria mercenaria TaxID=6596 RepID=UPI00234F7D15|nr:uncharacterized protein LOC128558007 [Mercenaria mercenaria]
MVSSISKTFYDKLPSKPVLHSLEDFELEVKTASGTLVNYLGYIEATIESKIFSHGSVTTLFLVVPTTEYRHNVPVLIGTNVIRELKENNIEAEDTPDVWKSAFMSVGSASVGIVTSTQPVTLKPMESRTISGFVRKTRNVDAAVTEPIEDNFQQKSIVCPRVVQLTNSGKTARVPVKICNISAKVVKIPARSEICQLNEVKVIRHADIGGDTSIPEKANESNISENFLPDLKYHPVSHQQTVPEKEKENTLYDEYNIKQAYGVDIEESELSTQQKQKVYNLFNKWKSVFPKGPHNLGHTTAVRHKIELTDNTPFKEPYRRVPPAIYNEVREHLQEMLKIGAIQESNSPWFSNVVIVKKKDGTIRF